MSSMSDPVPSGMIRRRHPGQRRRAGLVAAVAVAAAAIAACGTSAPPPTAGAVGAPPVAQAPSAAPAAARPSSEVSPSGDIPDNQAYVPYPSPDGMFTVSVPEGWSRSVEGAAVVFTDKLNTVRIESEPRPQPPTETSARTQELPTLGASVPGFAPGQISTVNRNAGPAVLSTYQARSAPDPVTGKSAANAVERYEFWRAGQQVTLTLSAPVGADNVDPWKMITDSLRWPR